MGQRKILYVGGALVLILFGILTGYLISENHMITKIETAGEMDKLKADLSDYIVSKLKEEKKDSTLIDISVLSPVPSEDGSVKFTYTLSFQTPVDGQPTVSSVQATAVVKKTGNAWRVVKVVTEKESVGFTEAAAVSP